MNIVIDDTYSVDSDGRSFRVRKNDQHIAHCVSPQQVAMFLVQKGIVPEGATCLGLYAVHLADRMERAFRLVCPSHAAAIERKAVLDFGNGHFRTYPNAAGGWVLHCPSKDVFTLNDRVDGKADVVGYPGTVQQLFTLAMLRSLQSSELTFRYASLNDEYRKIADSVVAGACVTFGGGPAIPIVVEETATPQAYVPSPEAVAKQEEREKAEHAHTSQLVRQEGALKWKREKA